MGAVTHAPPLLSEHHTWTMEPAGAQSIKQREHLYRLILSQLRYDGYETAASVLGKSFNAYPPSAPSSRLSHLVRLGEQLEAEAGKPGGASATGEELPHVRGQGLLDLEFESDENITAPPAIKHEVSYVTSHKGPVLCACFSHDGRLVACGSADNSIKMLDVERMMSKTALGHQQQDLHPVIRTMYDHEDAVLAIDFHPSVSVLASGSADTTVKFYDYSKPSVKRSYKVVQEVTVIRCLSFHPSGDYILVGTDQSTLRLYDVNTLQCFVSSDARDQHSAALTSVNYSLDGRIYATSSKDGDVKVWDGVSNRCINTFKRAHGGEQVTSVRLSKNAKFMLTSGFDGQAKLWELTTGNCLNTYKPNKLVRPHYPPMAVFNHTEDYVLMGEEGQNMLYCWESRTTQSFRPLFTSHQGPIRALAHSPSVPGFITCGDDCRVRFFSARELG